MRLRLFERRAIRKMVPIYIVNLFVSLHYAAILYVNSSNLEKFFSSGYTSILFIVGALGNILLFILAPKILKKIENRTLLSSLILLEILASFGLAISHTPLITGLAFILHSSVVLMIYYSLDLFIEDASSNKETGEVRGVDLTVSNLAIIAGPLLIAFFTPDGDFSLLYFVSTILLIPTLFVVFFHFRKYKDGVEKITGSLFEFKLWLREKNIRRVTVARFILEVFYTVMVIYTPIYLSNTIGFSWSQIGLIFTIMLLPFVLFELPIGELSDHWSKEKEIMTVGFFIMGLSLLVMPFLHKDLLAWAIILFTSRIGASFVEVTTESFFFRHVWKNDVGLISIFRIVRPVSVVAGSIIGGLIVSAFDPRSLFFILALLVFYGTQKSALLKEAL